MKTFAIRAASGLSLGILIIFGILWSKWFYLPLILLITVGGLWEFYTLSSIAHKDDGKYAKRYKYLAISFAVVIQLLSFLMNHRYSFIDISYVFPVFLFTFFIIELYAKSENPFENIAWNVVGLVYILLPVLILNKLYFDKGKLFVLAILFISWFYDSWCYIFGSLIGRTKLFERVSPKKTIEGLAGGLIVTLTLAYFYPVILTWVAKELPTFIIYAPTYTSWQWVFIALVATIACTYGDLAESLLKRSVNVKDSGNVMPGHGGFLDRLDAIILSVPFIALAAWLADQFQQIKLLLDFLQS
ncbi:MAG: phosphatidate cytidylyltransferase [Chitinophagales bacterium]|jgi:phosphatidate cytidylyltransferase